MNTCRAAWGLAQTGRIYMDEVHRLNEAGAVVTHTAQGTSKEGFDAEWREVMLIAFEHESVCRCELFDESDVNAALTRFDELSLPTPRLENAASRMYFRFNAHLAARDWDAMAEMIADDLCDDDRRRVVSSGIRRGRDAQLANLRAIVDVGVTNIDLVVIATRGERLALARARVQGGDQQAEAFGLEMLNLVEIDTDKRLSAGISFDIDDIDAAFAELDARYLAGEAAVARSYLVRLRRGPTPGLINRGAPNRPWTGWTSIIGTLAPIASGDMIGYMRTVVSDARGLQDLRRSPSTD